MRSRKQKWPSPQGQKINQVARSSNIPAHRADGSAQSPPLNVHPPMTIQMIDSAASAAAQPSRRMRVVHHHDAVVLLREVAKRRQRSDVAVNRKTAVRNHQLLTA